MTTLSSTTKYTNALLQTTLVTANGPDKKCQARILVDTGSQKAFITQHLRNMLQLKSFQRERLDITTFGSTQSTSETYEVVKLKRGNRRHSDNSFSNADHLPTTFI